MTMTETMTMTEKQHAAASAFAAPAIAAPGRYSAGVDEEEDAVGITHQPTAPTMKQEARQQRAAVNGEAPRHGRW